MNPDATIRVEERIEVDFSESRHGIYRTIPVRYTDPKGYGFSLGFRLVEVVDDQGMAYGTKVSHEGRFVKIRIGDADRTVHGRRVYIVRYTAQEAVTRFAEHDELYWNITGNDWPTTIGHASATIHLPAPLPADSLMVAGYSGAFGSTERAVEIRYPEPGLVRADAQRSLAALEGISVAVGWPQGYVAFPSRTEKTLRRVTDNWILLAPVLAFFLLMRTYRKSGKDPQGPAAVMVRYEPPPDMTPGEIGTLVDERVDLGDITASLVDLAVRGFLTIRVEESKVLLFFNKEETFFERGRTPKPGELRAHEELVLSGIFKHGEKVSTADLKEEFYKDIPGIKDAILDDLTERKYFAGKPTSVRTRWVVTGFAVGILVGAVGLLYMAFRGYESPLVPLVSAVLTTLLFVIFAPAMPRRTAAGVRMRVWAQGFEEFVDRVEREHLEAAERRNVFETLLPYAMALGVAGRWAKKFEGIYEQAGPSWYVGHHALHHISTSSLEQSVSNAMASAGKSMAASPRSSGSSGVGSPVAAGVEGAAAPGSGDTVPGRVPGIQPAYPPGHLKQALQSACATTA